MFFLFRQKKKGGELFCFSSVSNSTNFANFWEIFVKFSISKKGIKRRKKKKKTLVATSQYRKPRRPPPLSKNREGKSGYGGVWVWDGYGMGMHGSPWHSRCEP
jgi:hypothetical protein